MVLDDRFYLGDPAVNPDPLAVSCHEHLLATAVTVVQVLHDSLLL
jgi:hypothetical protein